LIENYKKIADLLDRRERRQAVLLSLLAVGMGVLDVVGVASILPFLSVVSNPDLIQTNPMLARAHELLGAPETRTFLIMLGLGAFLFVLFAALFRAFTFYALTYFVRMRVPSLSLRLMERYLAQPYAWFLTRHTSDLGKSILSEVAQVVNGPIQASVRLVAHTVMLVSLVMLLLILQPRAALGAAVLFGGAYGLILLVTKTPLARMGRERIEANREKFQIMQEAMGGIKNVKLGNLERSYIDRFRDPARVQARNQAALSVISDLPRHMLEVIAFGGMILFVLWLLASRGGSVSEVIPILGVYAFAAARMFPTIQQFFGAISAIRFGRPALDQIHADLTGPSGGDLERGSDLPPMGLRDGIELDRVSFAFPGADRPALDDLNVRIDAHTSVGIVGSTGAGKTTAVDLLLGLLRPQEGALRIDGVEITDANIRAWQKSIGYVPQDIFLVDDTVAANIAFGVPPGQIDMAAVERAARMAELHDFVTGELPRGYDTKVGERGTRLSGGQRQRIGIARALYRDPDVLVFDEATSALDMRTERAVMDAVRRLGGSKTIIMIAHRLSTVRDCDQILMLEKGRIAAKNDYDGLVRDSSGFRAMLEGVA
jgi:ABC-type multidrug transport system fused ATPase/permease subunit